MEENGIPRMLNTVTAAKKLGCAETTIRLWIRQGKVKYSLVAGRYMVFATEIVRLINEGIGKKTPSGRKAK